MIENTNKVENEITFGLEPGLRYAPIRHNNKNIICFDVIMADQCISAAGPDLAST